MKSTKLVFLVTALLSGNAMADAMIGSQATVKEPVIEYVPAGTVLPMLEMKFNCGACEQNPKIKALVEGAYLDQLELEKATVDESKKTELSVTHYRSRGKARMFVGILAGADNISGTINCNGVDVNVSDTALSAVNGIESVARNVGKDAYKVVKTCVLGAISADTNPAPIIAPAKSIE